MKAPVCSVCDSENILRVATLYFDKDKQQWVPENTTDEPLSWCDDCGSKCWIITHKE